MWELVGEGSERKYGVSVAYDEYRGKIFRFFGRGEGLYDHTSEVEIWDSAQRIWRPGPSLPPSAARSGATAAFDRERGVFVVQGGGRSWIDEDGTGRHTSYFDTLELSTRAPGIMSHPEARVVECAGGTALFAAAVFGGPYTYQWYRNGQAIPGANGLLLVRDNLQASDAGEYVLGVSNDCGTTFSTGSALEVREPIRIEGPPLYTRTACPGQSPIMIAPTPAGTQPIELRLQRKIGETWLDVPGQSGPPGHLFQVLEARNSDTGEYRFALSNYCGEVYSETGHLQVGVTFAANPANATVNPCETASFEVSARGVGELRYQWQRDGVNLDDGDRVHGARTERLTIEQVRYEDEAKYRCVVTDNCESRASDAAELRLPTPGWVRRSLEGPVYRNRDSTDMVFDPIRGVSVLFGGYALLGGFVDDTWEWDGIEWVRRTPDQTPGRRGNHKMIWDAHNQRVLLFGGSGQMPYNSEIWQYDGQNWSLVLGTVEDGPLPAPGIGDAAYDEARKRMVILRNPAGGGRATETWEFDIEREVWEVVRWTEEAGMWPAPSYGPLVYYPPRQETLGYYYWVIDATASTYAWNGANWREIVVSNEHRQSNPAAAYDPVRRQVVFYGCCRNVGSPVDMSETWAFDGRWNRLLESFHTNRDAVKPATLAFDTRRRAMVMTGSNYEGSRSDRSLETWEYRYLDAVEIDRGALNVALVAGGTAEFEVHAAGAGTLSYQWLKDGLVLTDGERPWGSRVTGATSAALRVENMGAEDRGGYEVIVSNACGSQMAAAAWLGAPTEPLVVTHTTEGGTITLRWPGGGTLHSAPEVTGPWTNTNQGSPATIEPTGARRFFQVVY